MAPTIATGMIASSDVDSARSCVIFRISTRPGTNSTPPPIPSMPAETPATKPTASVAMMSPLLTGGRLRRPLVDDQGRGHDQQEGKDPGQRPRRHALL